MIFCSTANISAHLTQRSLIFDQGNLPSTAASQSPATTKPLHAVITAPHSKHFLLALALLLNHLPKTELLIIIQNIPG